MTRSKPGVGALVSRFIARDVVQNVERLPNKRQQSGLQHLPNSLTEAGIPIGTVIAFVIGGAGISIPNLVLLNKLFERRLLAIYATTVVSIGITVGVLFNTVFTGLL